MTNSCGRQGTGGRGPAGRSNALRTCTKERAECRNTTGGEKITKTEVSGGNSCERNQRKTETARKKKVSPDQKIHRPITGGSQSAANSRKKKKMVRKKKQNGKKRQQKNDTFKPKENLGLFSVNHNSVSLPSAADVLTACKEGSCGCPERSFFNYS